MLMVRSRPRLTTDAACRWACRWHLSIRQSAEMKKLMEEASINH